MGMYGTLVFLHHPKGGEKQWSGHATCVSPQAVLIPGAEPAGSNVCDRYIYINVATLGPLEYRN